MEVDQIRSINTGYASEENGPENVAVRGKMTEYVKEEGHANRRGEDESETKRSMILLVGKSRPRESGNATTLHRLSQHVESSRYKCIMIDPGDVKKQETSTYLQSLIQRYRVTAAVGLHLYRSASLLLACKELQIPYMCYFGGTDVNEDVKDSEKLQVMSQVVSAAKYLIAFTNDMKSASLVIWPFLEEDMIKVLPQTVSVDTNVNFDVYSWVKSSEQIFRATNITSTCANIQNNSNFIQHESHIAEQEKHTSHPLHSRGDIENRYFLNQRKLRLNSELKIKWSVSSGITKCSSCSLMYDFNANKNYLQLPEECYPLVVLIAGLRPVKDVMFVADAWSKWHEERGRKGRLIIMGPTLDNNYARIIKTQALKLNGVIVTEKLDPAACQEVIRNATVLLNTSLSEGMSAAILEAMALGTPVLARNIPGNSAIIKHGVNGLLFDSSRDFLIELQSILEDTELLQTLTMNAIEYLHINHCAELEKTSFLQLLADTATSPKL